MIAGPSAKAESLVRDWPSDGWELLLHTKEPREWYRGMRDQLGDRWRPLRSFEQRERSPTGDRRVGAPRAARWPLGRAASALVKSVRKDVRSRFLRAVEPELVTWAWPALRDLEAVTGGRRPDVVLSVFGPLAADLIGAAIAARFGVPWVSYMRDHCTSYNGMLRVPLLWHLQAAWDRRVHRRADLLLGVSEPFVAALSDFFDLAPGRTGVLTGGHDEELLDPAARERSRRRRERTPRAWEGGEKPSPAGDPPSLRVGYLGRVYRHQVPALLLLLDALAEVERRRIHCELVLQIRSAHYLFPRAVRRRIAALRAVGVDIQLGTRKLPHAEALRMSEAADVNVVLEGMSPPHSTAGTATGKVFDLMMIAMPTLAVCAGTLPIGDFLRQTGVGTHCDQLGELVERLEEVWRWKADAGGPPGWYAPHAAAIAGYSRRALAERMAALCGDLLDRANLSEASPARGGTPGCDRRS